MVTLAYIRQQLEQLGGETQWLDHLNVSLSSDSVFMNTVQAQAVRLVNDLMQLAAANSPGSEEAKALLEKVPPELKTDIPDLPPSVHFQAPFTLPRPLHPVTMQAARDYFGLEGTQAREEMLGLVQMVKNAAKGGDHSAGKAMEQFGQMCFYLASDMLRGDGMRAWAEELLNFHDKHNWERAIQMEMAVRAAMEDGKDPQARDLYAHMQDAVYARLGEVERHIGALRMDLQARASMGLLSRGKSSPDENSGQQIDVQEITQPLMALRIARVMGIKEAGMLCEKYIASLQAARQQVVDDLREKWKYPRQEGKSDKDLPRASSAREAWQQRIAQRAEAPPLSQLIAQNEPYFDLIEDMEKSRGIKPLTQMPAAKALF